MKRCKNRESSNDVIYQKTLQHSKLKVNRTNNTCIHVALTELEKSDDANTLEATATRVSQIVLRKKSDGIVPHDADQFVEFSACNGQVLGL